MLSFDPSSCTVTVPSGSRETIRAAIEYLRLTVETEDFSSMVGTANDALDGESSVLLELSNDEDIHHSQAESLKSSPNTEEEFIEYYAGSHSNAMPAVGDRVELFWVMDREVFPGSVSAITPGGLHHVKYDDGGEESLKMSSWTRIFGRATSISPSLNVVRDLQYVIAEMFAFFRNKPFMCLRTQAFAPYATANAYGEENKN